MAWVVAATPLTIPRYGAVCGVFAVCNRTLSLLLILLLCSVPCMLGLM